MSGKCPHCRTVGAIAKGTCRFCHREVNPPKRHYQWDDNETVCGRELLGIYVAKYLIDVTCKRCTLATWLKRVEKEDETWFEHMGGGFVYETSRHWRKNNEIS